MITKILEFWKSITERAFSADDTGNKILVSSVKAKEVKLCLYDYVTLEIVGYITAGLDARTGYFIIDRSSADKGWGPFMYSLMLQTVYPLGVKPSSNIRPAALNVYRQFLKNPRVETHAVPETDPNYASMWKPDVMIEPIDSPEETKLINTLFKMPREPWYQSFVDDSEKVIADNSISTKQVFKDCLTYFESKYYSVAESLKAPHKDISDKYLLVNERGSTMELMIQDRAGKIFAYAELIKKSYYYQSVNVAAEKGWGPFLYDTVMSYLDMPVRPNRSLTREAWNVWEAYLTDRPDVHKTDVMNKDAWDSVDLDHKDVTNSHYAEPLNYLYTIYDRRDAIENWIAESDRALVEPMVEKFPRWKEIRFNQAKKYFNTRYPMGR